MSAPGRRPEPAQGCSRPLMHLGDRGRCCPQRIAARPRSPHVATAHLELDETGNCRTPMASTTGPSSSMFAAAVTANPGLSGSPESTQQAELNGSSARSL